MSAIDQEGAYLSNMIGGIFLLLGSNVGPRRQLLESAIIEIGSFATIVQRSSLYATEAWGKNDQPEFLNQALEIDTSLDPESLLSKILSIEQKLGRTREEKWGPRTIDIDLLLYRDIVWQTSTLTIPHPEIQNRNFALEPLNEIAASVIHPVRKQTIFELKRNSPDPLKVLKVQPD